MLCDLIECNGRVGKLNKVVVSFKNDNPSHVLIVENDIYFLMHYLGKKSLVIHEVS